jgi:ubiquinone/menaquinone biosynthesis C-methylase UbiE
MHTKIMAEKYDKLSSSDDRFGRTDYLVSKELPNIISKYNISSTILDFGCGTGLSTRFLKKMNYDCIGVDHNKQMLEFAKLNDPSGLYLESTVDSLPFECGSFEMVVAVFVLFEMPTLKTMINSLGEISRILKPGGVLIAITGSEELYKRDWLSLDVRSFHENKNPKSRDVCKIKLTHVDLVLEDYFWTDNDYTYAAEEAGFTVSKKSFPLGSIHGGMDWKDEVFYPPFVFYEFIADNNYSANQSEAQ